jgi:hypothetical protein
MIKQITIEAGTNDLLLTVCTEDGEEDENGEQTVVLLGSESAAVLRAFTQAFTLQQALIRDGITNNEDTHFLPSP